MQSACTIDCAAGVWCAPGLGMIPASAPDHLGLGDKCQPDNTLCTKNTVYEAINIKHYMLSMTVIQIRLFLTFIVMVTASSFVKKTNQTYSGDNISNV